MKKLNITAKNHIFLIGIGGISMSGLANMLVKIGIKVSGSDQHTSQITKNLSNIGIKIYEGHSKNNIESDVDLVVFTGAISSDNEELLFCKENGIQTVERSEFLGVICTLFKKVISVSGTHGKTTTTAMIGEVLVFAGLNPTIHVGGEVVGTTGNFRIGGNEIFVTEACEYKKSLVHLESDISVITNLEADHMDCYSSFEDLVNTFQIFANNTKEIVITNSITKNLIKHKNLITCGGYNWQVKNKTFNNLGFYSFDVYKNDVYYNNFNLKVIGEYQVNNALYAIVVCDYLGLSSEVIKQGLYNFKGVKRRNELMGNYLGVPVFADYAHHPTEIVNSVKAFKNIYKNVLVVFQPHTYTRTKTLKAEFVNCFNDAKRLILYKTYPAREKYLEGGDVKDMYNYINYKKNNKILCKDKEEVKKAINKFIKKCKVIVFLGAGDMYNEINDILSFN